jgi:hypothetical protein
MDSRRGQLRSRFAASSVGGGLFARARAVSFALLGMTAAVGLGLVAFISQVGWPDIRGGPIPGLPIEHGAAHARVPAPGPTAPVHVLAHALKGRTAFVPGPSTPTVLPTSGVSGSSEVGAPLPPKAHGGGPSGSGDAGGSPAGQPPTAAPVSVPAPEPAPSASSPPTIVASTNGSSKSRGRARVAHPAPHALGAKGRSPESTSTESGGKGNPSSSGYTGSDPGHGRGHAYGRHDK